MNWPNKRSYLGVGIDDEATGLTHIGAREYDQNTGRFLSADPIIDIADPLQMNGYAYSNNSPISMSDPTGLKPVHDAWRWRCVWRLRRHLKKKTRNLTRTGWRARRRSRTIAKA